MRRKEEFSNMYSGTGKVDNEAVAKFLLQLRNFNRLNKIYKKNIDKEGIVFIDSVINSLNISVKLNSEELSRIPKTGSFITVSNHPFGGIDGLLLLKLIYSLRPDFKLLTNSLLHRVDPLGEYSFEMCENYTKEFIFSDSAKAKAKAHLQAGLPLGIFPAGEISKVQSHGNISDTQWKTAVLEFIKEANVPVVPIYFLGNNSWVFNLLGNLHPLLKSAGLPKKFFRPKVKNVNVRIGQAITPRQQADFEEIEMYGRFLRAKTYTLGSLLEVNKFFMPKFMPRLKKIKKIIPPVPTSDLKKEIKDIKKDYHLFDSGTFSVFCAPSEKIPNLLTEIGRLREITFREVGEGSNRSIDIDEFDLYFWQLIIWDNKADRIVGAYRVGRGDEIFEKYGVSGFYFQTLFKVKPEFYPILKESLELGRSFVVKEYQRRPLSLFMLWKGILYFLLKNNNYRYLLGPASISNDYSKFSQSLIVDFFKENFFDHEKASFIEPRKEFKLTNFPNFDKEVFHKTTTGDVSKLDKFIQDIEPDYNTPVLFKKYIKLNGKLLGFNVDPKFNYCVDGLIILDVFDVPLNTLEALSKELDDSSILSRFNF